MLIPELIKHAVNGDLRFDFIESTLTIHDGTSLTSLKGHGSADPAHAWFHYQFLSHAPISEEWMRSTANASARPDADAMPRFRVEGIERGSANWTGAASDLRFVRSGNGKAIHARVDEWSRADQRSVHLSFARIVIPGRLGYPVAIRHAAGFNARMASVDWEGIRIDFRDYDEYTEVCAYSPNELPVYFSESLVHALGAMLDCPMHWVYRERHADKNRIISVRALQEERVGMRENSKAPSTKTATNYREFWQSYTRKLGGFL